MWLQQVRRVVLLRFLGKAPTQSSAYLHSARFGGYLLHLLFLICGMHGLKPFNILCVFGVLQILWYLGYFEVGYWFSPVHVRGVTGDCGLYEMSSGTWQAHTHCAAQPRKADSARCGRALRGKALPCGFFGIRLGMWYEVAGVQGFSRCLLSSKSSPAFRFKRLRYKAAFTGSEECGVYLRAWALARNALKQHLN